MIKYKIYFIYIKKNNTFILLDIYNKLIGAFYTISPSRKYNLYYSKSMLTYLNFLKYIGFFGASPNNSYNEFKFL